MRCTTLPFHLDLSFKLFLPGAPDAPSIVSNLEACYSRIVSLQSGMSSFFLLGTGMQLRRVPHQHICSSIPQAFSLIGSSPEHAPTVTPIPGLCQVVAAKNLSQLPLMVSLGQAQEQDYIFQRKKQRK